MIISGFENLYLCINYINLGIAYDYDMRIC